MEEIYEPTLFEMIWQLNVLGKLAVFLPIVCTVSLLLSRIRRRFRTSSEHVARDLAFLLSGPVTALLYACESSMVGVGAYLRGGLDSGAVLMYQLRGAAVICVIAFFCFAVGLLALALSTRSKPVTAT